MKPEKLFIVLVFVFLVGWLPGTIRAGGAESGASRGEAAADRQMELPDIKDIKILAATLPPSAALGSGLALLLLAAGIGSYFLLRENGGKARIPTPYETAAEALETLQKTDLSTPERIIDFYTGLSGILRSHIESEYGIRATAMTTEEFLAELRNSEPLFPGYQEPLRDFMLISDRVKFAGFEPPPEEISGSFRLVKAIIEQRKEKQA